MVQIEERKKEHGKERGVEKSLCKEQKAAQLRTRPISAKEGGISRQVK
jgi:hypothetical protein